MPPPHAIFPPTTSTSTSHSFPSTHLRRGSGTATTIITVANNTTTPKQLPLNTSPFFSKYDKKWQWWHYLSIFILIVGFVQFIILTLGYRILHSQSSPIRIAVQQYPSIKYQHFDMSAFPPTKSILPKGTTVYHVTKEFGPASLGGMGSVLTSLAAAQQRSGNTDVAVIIPYYSFLKNKFDIERVVDLVIDLRDNNGKLVPIEFRVWKMMHVFNPPPPAVNITTYEMIDGINKTITKVPDPVTIPHTERVPVYLIGPGNRRPFSQAFKCRSALHIYSSPQGLPQEWKDQYFSKAAAQFLAHQSTAVDEESLFAPILRTSPHVDVIHIHGATNAYVAKFLDDKRKKNQLGANPPSIIYTMHDYLDELQYTNTVNNVKKFLDTNEIMAEDKNYIHGDRMFMSSLGIERADMVTFVSRTMASAMVEGNLDFYLKELIMDRLLSKAQQRRFFGISNGLDFAHINPFKAEKLVARKLNFTNFAQQLLEENTSSPLPSSSALTKNNNGNENEKKMIWKLSATSSDFIASAKEKAKKFLVKRKLISEEGLKRPLVLFIGRFQYNKGLEWFEQATEHFVAKNMTFVILGQQNNYPFEKLEALKTKYPDHVYLLHTPKQHRQWSIFCRAAADFVFVPSQTESFGLVAAEGLMFGASVISTGVGGLKEFLIDRPKTQMERKSIQLNYDDNDNNNNDPSKGNDLKEKWVPIFPQPRDIHLVRDKKTKIPTVTSGEIYNAYLFNDKDGLTKAIEDASLDYKRLMASKALKEEYHLRMIANAISLGWDRHGKGPVHEYQHVYALALQHRSLPELTRHEIEEEQSRLRRLYQAEIN
ncbi:unnamed protein product [Cunninghamella blakesleeana]